MSQLGSKEELDAVVNACPGHGVKVQAAGRAGEAPPPRVGAKVSIIGG
eukprot:gene55423-61455_t